MDNCLIDWDKFHQIDWDKFRLPYSQAVSELKLKLQSLVEGFYSLSQPSPIESVEGRTKKTESIIQKAMRKRYSAKDIENKIEDIAGIRIICRFLDDIPQVVEMIRDRNGVDLTIVKERDYVKNMKASGYRSYHIVIKYPVFTALGRKEVLCEIQIRTLAMNFWSVLEHSIRYKYKGNVPDDISLRLIRSAYSAHCLDEDINEIKKDIIDGEQSRVTKETAINTILKGLQSIVNVAPKQITDQLNNELVSIFQSDDRTNLIEFEKKLKDISFLYLQNKEDYEEDQEDVL
jgi:putative GTP pyrophosphokinase